MKRFVVIDKHTGETPLMAIQRWKKKHPAYAAVAASYAGRLDPMASGILLVLLGDECKRQRSYTNLDKGYEIEVLLDVGSDTGDILGHPSYTHQETIPYERLLNATLRQERGAHSRAYPVFSSKTVRGKPLFLYALEGMLSTIEVPKHIERIYRIQNIGSYNISHRELHEKISALLDLVPHTDEPSKRLGENFRVDAIRTSWESLFETVPERNFIVLRLRVTCASGTYMRSLVGRIGAELGTKALALSIRRTKIGTYIPIWKAGVWARTY